MKKLLLFFAVLSLTSFGALVAHGSSSSDNDDDYNCGMMMDGGHYANSSSYHHQDIMDDADDADHQGPGSLTPEQMEEFQAFLAYQKAHSKDSK